MLNVSVKNGTRSGIRKPWTGGHGPKCVCTACARRVDL